MSGIITTSRDNAGHQQAALRDLLINYNLLVADLELLRAQDAYLFANDVLSVTTGATSTNGLGVKTTSTLTYANGGKLLTKAAADPIWTPGTGTSNTVVAANSWQKYLLCLNAAGAASVYEGVQSAVSAAAVKLPSVATLSGAGVTVIETLTVATDGTHTFTPGTTGLAATGITSSILGGLDPLFLVQSAALLAAQIGNLLGVAINS